jgi:hypothetical protein
MLWLGIFIGIVLAAVIGYFYQENHEPEHEHDWKVRGAHQMYSVNTYHGIPLTPTEEGEPITKVLWRCECGAVETETEEGHWTFEQLSGVAGSGETIEAEESDESEEEASATAAAPVSNEQGGADAPPTNS